LIGYLFGFGGGRNKNGVNGAFPMALYLLGGDPLSQE
jgi:hypothetical protein